MEEAELILRDNSMYYLHEDLNNLFKNYDIKKESCWSENKYIISIDNYEFIIYEILDKNDIPCKLFFLYENIYYIGGTDIIKAISNGNIDIKVAADLI